jgi:TPR repeat protein
LYRLSAEKGTAIGEHNFGRCLERGLGVGKDLDRSREYFRRSLDHDASALCSLGRCFVDGTGVPADEAKGAALVRRAADERRYEAVFLYAQYLEEGKGVAKDAAAAARPYRRVMDRGFPDARRGYERCSRIGGSA